MLIKSNSHKYKEGINNSDIVAINLNFPVQNFIVLSKALVAYDISFVIPSKAHMEVISALCNKIFLRYLFLGHVSYDSFCNLNEMFFSIES